jgi:NAD-dependent oxidoreductase involved in siderophore biosynthesis
MNKIEILKLIQSEMFRVKTIETQGKDNLDEHLVHIKTLVSLVEKAFEQGKKYIVHCQNWDVVPKTRSLEYGDIEL